MLAPGNSLSWLEVALAALLALGLGLALARHLWALRWRLSRDRSHGLPLPPGSMGWPFFGETLHWLVQVREHRRWAGDGLGIVLSLL